MADLGRAIEACQGAGDPRIQILIALNDLERDLPGLPLSKVVREEFNRLKDVVNGPRFEHDLRRDVLSTMLYNFESNLHQDLLQHSYFLIPQSRRAYFEQPDLFGPKVTEVFEDATQDIAAAGRCIALDEWTAAVFHLMRAAELALQRLADDLGIDHPEGFAWGYLLKHIDGRLRELDNEPKSPERASDRILLAGTE